MKSIPDPFKCVSPWGDTTKLLRLVRYSEKINTPPSLPEEMAKHKKMTLFKKYKVRNAQYLKFAFLQLSMLQICSREHSIIVKYLVHNSPILCADLIYLYCPKVKSKLSNLHEFLTQ